MPTNHYLTSLDEDYATCERTNASLRITCGDKSPRFVSDFLKLNPTKMVEVGVAGRPNSLGRAPVGKLNLWILDSESHVISRDLRHHLDWLLDQVEPAASGILELQQIGFLMDIFAIWWSKTGEGGPALWPAQMRRIANLDLELSIGFSDFGAE